MINELFSIYWKSSGVAPIPIFQFFLTEPNSATLKATVRTAASPRL